MIYRIVTDQYAGYECQYKIWWWPFWCELNGTNTHRTVEEAEEEIEKHKKDREFRPKVVKTL